jgi:hypothetical protein
VAWDNVVMERILYIRRFVGAPIKPAKIGVVLGKKKLRLNSIQVRIYLEVGSGADWRRRGKAVEMSFTQGGMPCCYAVDLVIFGAANRGRKSGNGRLLNRPGPSVREP